MACHELVEWAISQFTAYSVAGNTLRVRMPNSDVVKKDVKSSEALAEAIAVSKDSPSLFRDEMTSSKANQPGRFPRNIRVSQSSAGPHQA